MERCLGRLAVEPAYLGAAPARPDHIRPELPDVQEQNGAPATPPPAKLPAHAGVSGDPPVLSSATYSTWKRRAAYRPRGPESAPGPCTSGSADPGSGRPPRSLMKLCEYRAVNLPFWGLSTPAEIWPVRKSEHEQGLEPLLDGARADGEVIVPVRRPPRAPERAAKSPLRPGRPPAHRRARRFANSRRNGTWDLPGVGRK